MTPRLFLFAFFLAAFGLALPTALRAEPAKAEHVEDLLEKAKTAADPIPLLRKAKEALEHYHPAPGHAKEVLRGIHAKAEAAEDVAAREHKHAAMEAIQKAIEKAQAGEAPAGIDNAIALVHHTATFKH